MKQYDEYIHSELPWVDEIPSHWQKMRAKYMYRKENRAVRAEDKVVTCFRDGMVTLREKRRTSGFTNAIQEVGYQGVRKGDLVIHVMDAFAGAVGVSDSDGKGTPVYSVCTAIGDYNNYYFAHIVRMMAKTGYIQSLYRGIRERSSDFRFEIFANQYLPVPPRAEQDQIVHYLDWQVSKINRLIAAKRQQLVLLKEQENRIIDKVVSHGLHEAEMVDSKYDWLGYIPKHWTTKKIKSFCKLQNGISESGDFFQSGTPFLSYGDVYKHITVPEIVNGVAQSNPKQQEIYSVRRGDYFFTRTSETIEEVGMPAVCIKTIDKAVFSGFLIRVRPDTEVLLPEFAKYYLHFSGIQNYFSRTMNIVIRASLGQSVLKELAVVVPPIEEQKEIAEYLDKQHGLFKNAYTTIDSSIRSLIELRTRLISDVVTGQIDVRGIEIPDFEYTADIETDSSDDEDSGDDDTDMSEET